MSNAYLAPTLTFKSWTNNGLPNAGGTLTTYSAGTVTPLASYTDSTAGTPNANPLTLNSRGEANVWIPPNVGYKFVEADASGNIFKTTDQVSLSQLISLVAGPDTGTANAYVVTLVTPLPGYAGMGFYFIPANTNTGASTLNVSINNGASYLGPQALVNPGGGALTAGEMVAGNVYFVLYSGGQFLLSTPVGSSGLVNLAGVNYTGATLPTNGIYLPSPNVLGISINTVVVGTISSSVLQLLSPALEIGSPTGGALGAGTINVANGVFWNNVQLGYLAIPVNSQALAYTTVLSDQGKTIYYSGAAVVTMTIAANASVAYPIGTVINFINDASAASNMTISINTDTLVLTGLGTVGPRTLVQFGKATAIKVAATRWYISGVGLS